MDPADGPAPSPPNAVPADHSPAPARDSSPMPDAFPSPSTTPSPPMPSPDPSTTEPDDTSSSSLPPPPKKFPQLTNNPPSSPDSRHLFAGGDAHVDDETRVPHSFDRSEQAVRPGACHDTLDASDLAIRRMHRFTLYETRHRFYIVGSDLLDAQFRILKIDRSADEGDLSITEDEVVYTRNEMSRLLATIEDGNIATGGLRQRMPFWGLLGFIRFTAAYYMLLITKRNQVAMVGGHYLYQIDNTELVPLTTDAASSRKPERNSEEARFISILGNLDLTRGFYFSHAYDITHTLQHNIIRERDALQRGLARPADHDYNDMFAWNHYLLEPAKEHMRAPYEWCMPIVHGYVDQANISVYGRSIYITVIARRSRYFAGARFLKRGANDLGYVANDVETEQIVSEMLTTSFHAPGKRLFSNPNYTSYVQHRGSIPLFWTQKNDAATPKPPVEMNLVDPFFSAAALHFDDLFLRYGAPIIVLNLVKSRERTPRESILLKEFTQAINYLNQFLPQGKRIRYIAWDMSRAAKSRDQDVIETLETIAENVLNTTGFFHNGSPTGGRQQPQLQSGVCRTNCIDCLDRTNAAQFVIGKRALGHQLHALGVISGTSIEYDTDAVDLFTHMYHDHGDTIAVQYAGSHLVNTMETYRKINQWTSHSRDMLESFKRYYNNSFLDGQRQEAYNLFLGNYIFAQGQPMLWDLSTDYYLHHADPRIGKKRRSYIKWWTPRNLEQRMLSATTIPIGDDLLKKPYHYFDDYWLEYYRPRALSSFWKVFSYNLNSTLRYIPMKQTQDGRYDLSPFVVRSSPTAAATNAAQQQQQQQQQKQQQNHASPPTPRRESAAEAAATSMAAATATAKRQPRIRLHFADFKFPPRPSTSPAPASSSAAVPSPHSSSSSRLTSWIPPRPHYHSHPAAHPAIETLSTSSLRAASPTTSTTKYPPALGATTSSLSTTAEPSEQRNLTTAVERSLHPSISDSEVREYERYMSHPQNLPLVTSIENPPPPNPDRGDFAAYVEAGRGGALQSVKDHDVALYESVTVVPDQPLKVGEGDRDMKRYRAYQRWVLTGRLERRGVAAAPPAAQGKAVTVGGK